MLGDGVARAEEIDVAMQRATNYPRGPLEWADAAGYPVVGELLAVLDEATGDGRYAPAARFTSGSGP